MDEGKASSDRSGSQGHTFIAFNMSSEKLQLLAKEMYQESRLKSMSGISARTTCREYPIQKYVWNIWRQECLAKNVSGISGT